MLIALCLFLIQPVPPVMAGMGGAVVAWGHNSHGQTTVPVEAQTGVVAVSGGYFHSMALKSNGSVIAWGRNDYGERDVPVAAQSGVNAISAGNFYSLALKTDGSVIPWGYNGNHQLDVPAGLSAVAVVAGDAHVLALKSDGTLVSWGLNNYGQATVPSGLSGVVAMAGGYEHSLALKSDGTVVAWGRNDQGQTDVPLGLTGVVGIAAGYQYSLAVKSDGTVVPWGVNFNGQTDVPPDVDDVVAIAATGGILGGHSLALKSDGTVVAWGRNEEGQTVVPAGLNGVVAISAGYFHSLALVELIDVTPPLVSCPNLTVSCSADPLVPVIYPAPSVVDDFDPAPQVTYSPPSGSSFGAGATSVNCTVTDAAGNSSSTTFTVTREALTFSGFLLPIGGADATGGSFAAPVRTFKAGTTIPVKFSALCGGSAVTTGIHVLQAIKFSDATTAGTPIDATPRDAATTGNHFRLVGEEWHFNLDLRGTGMTTGIWQLTATLSDGTEHLVWVQIK